MQQARDTKSKMNDASTAQTDQLPAWDLSDLYLSPDDPRVMADLTQTEQTAKAFAQSRAGKLANLSGADLAAGIAEYEQIQEALGRVASYAQLLFAGDSSDAAIGRFYQTVNERVTAIGSDLIFFTLELNRLDDAVTGSKIQRPRACPLPPVVARSAGFPATPVVGRPGEADARARPDRTRCLGAPVRRNRRIDAHPLGGRNFDCQRHPQQTV